MLISLALSIRAFTSFCCHGLLIIILKHFDIQLGCIECIIDDPVGFGWQLIMVPFERVVGQLLDDRGYTLVLWVLVPVFVEEIVAAVLPLLSDRQGHDVALSV